MCRQADFFASVSSPVIAVVVVIGNKLVIAAVIVAGDEVIAGVMELKLQISS
jgi:hypothetical protein